MSKRVKKPALEWRWAEPPIERSTIAKVEDTWGIHFPSDYVTCVRLNHGGHPNLDCFDFGKRKESVFSHLLSFVEGDDPSITKTYEAIKDRLPTGVFPFAADPFGNYLCFDYRKGKKGSPSIVFWDHEAACSELEGAIAYVCGTFTKLIEKLYKVD